MPPVGRQLVVNRRSQRQRPDRFRAEGAFGRADCYGVFAYYLKVVREDSDSRARLLKIHMPVSRLVGH